MARPLPAHHHLSFPGATTATVLLLLAAIAAVSSIVLYLCTTHKRPKKKSHQLPTSLLSMSVTVDQKLTSAVSKISTKALEVAKMVSWKKADDSDSDDAVDDAVWRKSILMGGKCRRLDFSGQIIYDADGNQVETTFMSRSTETGTDGCDGRNRSTETGTDCCDGRNNTIASA